jgi:pyruvate/2-oxoglutarate dehydrogenase complex dihydrolipoamide acyltransferase (E2) component
MRLEVKIPEAGFSVTEGTLLEWQKKVGDRVQAGETLVAMETDKVSMEIPAAEAGVITEIRCQAGQVVPVGAVIAVIETAAAPAPATRESYRGKRISPLAKALARKHGADLSAVAQGTGPRGRIVRDDVLALVAGGPAVPAAAARVPAAPPMPSGTKTPFTGWRKIIAERMVASVRSIPHYTMSVEIDVTDIAALIEKSRAEGKGPKLTYLPFVMRAMALGISQVPEVNAHCFEDGYTILQQVNIGIAVDLGEKLLVPVIRDVPHKTIRQLAAEILETVQEAREDRLQPKDLEGGTITLTNVGVFNIHSGTSIIMQPQVAILYTGAVREVPAVVNGQICVRRLMIAGGTFDHRLVNGGPAGRFLNTVKGGLENLVLGLL